MKVAIIGSRTFNDYDKLVNFMTQFINWTQISLIVSGGAKGADALAEKYADAFGIEKLIFPADWEKYGKSAGMRRNQQIVNNAELVVACWDLSSKGTKDSINKALKAGKPVMIVPA